MFTHRTSSYFQENKNKFYIFALAFGILFFLSGCKSAQLEALEKEVSVIQLTTGREIRKSVNDKEWGFTGPIYAEILITYESINGHTKKEVYDEIITILEANSWDRTEENIGQSDYFRAYLPSSVLKVSVSIYPDENLVSLVMTNYSP